MPLPDSIASTDQLEDLLSQPGAGLPEALASLDGDFMVLGAGGKMGPSLCRMLRRALDAAGAQRRIFAVSRFSGGVPAVIAGSRSDVIESDLLAPGALDALPDAANVIYMAGMKFGSSGRLPFTWAMNAFLPGLVGRRYRGSRIAAFSTGAVYGMVPVTSTGSRETDEPRPVGEYAMSCLGRERVLEHISLENGTPVALLRLNWAVELRYGVPVDIALAIREGLPVDLSAGAANVIWQAEANSMALRSLCAASSPAAVFNIAGPEIVSIRELAGRMGRAMDREVVFRGAEGGEALLSDGSAAYPVLGRPEVTLDQIVRWTADWVGRGGDTLGKPTHFESTDGRF